MSGGIAYVLDVSHTFASKVNPELVELGPVNDPAEIAELRSMIEDHRHYTGSTIAERILRDFRRSLSKFVRVMPLEYKRVLEERAAREAEEKARQSVIDLIPSQTASQVDLAATLELKNQSLFGISRVTTPLASPKAHEPSVVDLEDAMVDENSTKERMTKLDKTRGFMKYKRLGEAYRPARKRVKDWNEISTRLTEPELKVQTARCMDCGVPFCQSDSGCPISNIIPKWNDLVFKGQWKAALDRLLMTNPFPEFTGRVGVSTFENNIRLSSDIYRLLMIGLSGSLRRSMRSGNQ
jgi:glutamate synthase (NADPH/NADH)